MPAFVPLVWGNRLNKGNVIFNTLKTDYDSSGLLITSDKVSLDKVKKMDKEIEQKNYVKMNNLKYVFQHKVYTGFPFIQFDKIYN